MRDKLILIVVSLLSFCPGFLLLFGYELGTAILGSLLLLLPLLFVFILIRRKGLSKRYYLLLLLNPLLFLPTATFTMAITFYFLGSPSLSYCGEPYGRYHPVYRMKVENNDCDFPLFDWVTDGIKNNTTLTLFHLFGFAKDSYLGEIPSKEDISEDFFRDGQEICELNAGSWTILLDNGESVPVDFYHFWFMFNDKKPTNFFKYKHVNPDLYVIGIFEESMGIMKAQVFLVPKKRFIQYYRYKDTWME